jgi:hypothetical protein
MFMEKVGKLLIIMEACTIILIDGAMLPDKEMEAWGKT